MFILYSGFNMVKETISPLLGQQADAELVEKINVLVLSHEGVLGVHDLLVHDYGPGNQFASLHIEFAAELDPLVAHDTIDNIEHDFLKQERMQVVIHYDPIVTSDSEVGELRAYISEQVKAYDERLSIHDLRIVPGETHVNVLFDLMVPPKFEKDKEELLKYISGKVKENCHGQYVHCLPDPLRSGQGSDHGG